jgi:putative ABC transport system permease protein
LKEKKRVSFGNHSAVVECYPHNLIDMLSNYLKIAYRNLIRHKGYALISLAGLSLGLASCMAIFLFIQDERSYDRYHSQNERIYRLCVRIDGAAHNGVAKLTGPWGPAVAAELPEVENMTRFVMAGQQLFEFSDRRLYENDGLYADSSVFRMFDWTWRNGNSDALHRPDAIVLTQSLAERYFNNIDPIGKALIVNGRAFTITGILNDIPTNSHFTFTFLLPMAALQHPDRDSWTQWNQFYTYLLLKPGASPGDVAAKTESLLTRYMDHAAAGYHPFLQSLPTIHLYSHLFREMNPNSDVSYLYIFSAIGFLILVISSINFVNLATARAMLRTREVGIRKSSGAFKGQLIAQYLSESVLLCLIALLLAGGVLAAVLPFFNSILNKQLTLDVFENLPFSLASLAIALGVGIVAGSYPAFFLAGLRPAVVLKGPLHLGGRHRGREVLVVVQFSISALLVISSSIIYRQLTFIQEKQLGFDPTALITIPIQDNSIRAQREAIRQQLLSDPSIVSVSFSGNQPGGGDWGIPVIPEGVPTNLIPPIRVLVADHDFVKTFEMELAKGRDFSREFPSDSSAYLINEEAAKELGWDEPLGKMLSMPAVHRPNSPVIGVLKDFHFRSLREKIGAVVLFIPPAPWLTVCTIRLSTTNVEEGLKSIEKTWSAFDPAHPFTFSFFDNSVGNLYAAERTLGRLVGFFTFIGIFIACLGLFSLAAFVTEQRTKELGIRKVLGASIPSIALLLSKNLLVLVLTGFVIAAPASYFIMEKWLGGFAYRTDISPLIFVVSGLGTMLLAWVTVSYKVIKAGLANPVQSLRSE